MAEHAHPVRREQRPAEQRTHTSGRPCPRRTSGRIGRSRSEPDTPQRCRPACPRLSRQRGRPGPDGADPAGPLCHRVRAGPLVAAPGAFARPAGGSQPGRIHGRRHCGRDAGGRCCPAGCPAWPAHSGLAGRCHAGRAPTRCRGRAATAFGAVDRHHQCARSLRGGRS